MTAARGDKCALEGSAYGNKLAPPGKVWRCQACGKRSRDRYGYQRIDHGYDVSCMLNAVLVPDEESVGQARRVSEGEA